MHSIEWAAGLFEGEGSLITDKRSNARALELNMTDQDVVEKFRDVVGAGRITQRYTKDNYRKPQWRVRIGKREDVIRILSAMLPYFGNRRAYKALNILDDLELA
jgi:DNA-binding transcriptional regulator WhiA